MLFDDDPAPSLITGVGRKHLDWEHFRSLFPVVNKHVYLNNAGVAPTSARVTAAIDRWVHRLASDGLLIETWLAEAEEVRCRLADFVGAFPREIAFVRNTSHGLALVAEGLDWRADDEVAVCTEIEYPSNVYPWLHLAERGVRVTEIEPVAGGVTVEAVDRAIGQRTRVLALSAVQYASGHRADLKAIGELCAERGVLFCVDGIQIVGAAPLDVKQLGIHFLSADGHKWMLGTPGIGFLFVDESVCDRLRPVLVGWKSTTDAFNIDRTHFELKTDASKFEEGTPAFPLIAGLGAAIGLLQELGLEQIQARIQKLLASLENSLLAIGCQVAPEPVHRAGILTFVKPGVSCEKIFQEAESKSIRISIRRDRMRVSPHVYNNERDIERLIELVSQL